MSHTLSQPEEVDKVLMEMAWSELKVDTPDPCQKQPNGYMQKDWYGGYVPPYRAVHMPEPVHCLSKP